MQRLEYIEINNSLATAKLHCKVDTLCLGNLNHKCSQCCGYQAMRDTWKAAQFVVHTDLLALVWRSPTDSTLCTHGFARVIPWQLVEAETTRDGATRLTLQMMETAETRRQLSYPYILSMTVTIGERLKIDLATTNKANHPFMIGGAFHTYFQVSDIAKIHVKGLEDALYSDKVFNYERRVEKMTSALMVNLIVFISHDIGLYYWRRGLNRQIVFPSRVANLLWFGRHGQKRLTKWEIWRYRRMAQYGMHGNG